MDSIEFIQSIYKGENIHECENHLKGFLKAKVQELIPEHFEEIKRYKELKANSVSALEIFESALDESADSDNSKALTKAIKSKYKLKNVKFEKVLEVDTDDDCVNAVFDFEDIEDIDDYTDSISKELDKALKGLKLKNSDGESKAVSGVHFDADISTSGYSNTALGFCIDLK